MARYTGCRVTIKLPPNYSKKEELSQALKSEFDEGELTFEEDATTGKPYAEYAFVPDTSPLSGALASSGWTPLTDPLAPMVNVSANLLLRSTEDAIQKFIREQSRQD
jgi:hypothetical protein